MKDLSFGLTMTIAGMGVTLATLIIMIFLIRVMIRLFPYKEEAVEGEAGAQGAAGKNS